jgi:O-antigen ligase
MLAFLPLILKSKYQVIILGAAGMAILALALTGGRMGYAAWGIVGLFMCLIKWRKYLILAPVVVVVLPVMFPGAAARMLEGFGQTDVTGQKNVDDAAVTSGRTIAWPYVIDKIDESPWIGYGRLAMDRTGLQNHIGLETGDFTFPHPHNMYLETLLDNGILGSIPIFLFWAIMVVYSTRLFMSRNHLYSAVGGLSLALAATSLVTGIGGQHFYAQEHTLGIWVAAFLMMRVYVEEKGAKMYDRPTSS